MTALRNFDVEALEQWSDSAYDAHRDADGNVTIPASRYEQMRADLLVAAEEITLLRLEQRPTA